MPTIKIAKKRFNELMGIDFTFEKLEDLGFEYGIEIEEDSEEDMESEIDPKTKTRKRIEFFRFECTNNRPDLLCEASLTRSLLLYLGKRKCPVVKTLPAVHQIIVDKSVTNPLTSGRVSPSLRRRCHLEKHHLHARDLQSFYRLPG
jgi:hypothetical protein